MWLPPGIVALYFEFDWLPGEIVCVCKPSHEPRSVVDYVAVRYVIPESAAKGVLYALSQVQDRKAMLMRMVASGVVK